MKPFSGGLLLLVLLLPCCCRANLDNPEQRLNLVGDQEVSSSSEQKKGVAAVGDVITAREDDNGKSDSSLLVESDSAKVKDVISDDTSETDSLSGMNVFIERTLLL